MHSARCGSFKIGHVYGQGHIKSAEFAVWIISGKVKGNGREGGE
jgi:hypothetical protein